MQADGDVAVSAWLCLRCDWTGGNDGAACPGAGLPSTGSRNRRGPARPPRLPARNRNRRGTLRLARRSTWFKTTRASRRRWRSRPAEGGGLIGGGALAVAAVLIVATGLPFDRAQTPAVPGPAETGPAGSNCVVTRCTETGPTPTPPAGTSLETNLIDLNTGDMTPLPKTIAGGIGYSVSPDGTKVAYLAWTGQIAADLPGSR
jgi:hypothetical protein